MGKKHFGKRDIDSFRCVIANEREIKRYCAILNLAENGCILENFTLLTHWAIEELANEVVIPTMYLLPSICKLMMDEIDCQATQRLIETSDEIGNCFLCQQTERNYARSCGWSHRASRLTTIWLRMIKNKAAVISRVLAVERNSGALSSTATVTVVGWRRQERPLLGDENWTINLNRRLLMCPSLFIVSTWVGTDVKDERLTWKEKKKWNHLTRLSAMWGLKVVFFFSKAKEIRIIFLYMYDCRMDLDIIIYTQTRLTVWYQNVDWNVCFVKHSIQ